MNLKELAEKQKAAKNFSISGSESGKTPEIKSSPQNMPKKFVLAKKAAAPKESVPQTPPPTASGTDAPESPASKEIVPVDPGPQELSVGEIPATQCYDELPGDMSEEMKGFIELVNRVPEMFDDADMMSQCLRRIMTNMQANHEFVEMLSDKQISTIIKGAKSILGFTQLKAESKKKGSNRKKGPSLDVDDMGEIDKMLEGLKL